MSVATTSSYRHRTWDQDMADAILTAAGIYRADEVMLASLKQKGAGRTHLALVTANQAQGLELVQQGARILITFDSKYEPILASVADIGGLDEVAKDKTYHVN
jgi:hypothetical protein